jgi:hypothetical protein
MENIMNVCSSRQRQAISHLANLLQHLIGTKKLRS